ncbi:MAG: hypothetical protein ACR2RV_21080, partial [Verrucomicrobiales bacterium]
DRLSLANYSDLEDETISFLDERGERSHAEFLRERFPLSTSRFFKSFGAPAPVQEPAREVAPVAIR